MTGLGRAEGPLPTLIVVGSRDYTALMQAEAIAEVDSAPEDEAWLFYTSGTTGRPKGAVLTHRNLQFMAQCYYADVDHLDERDVKLHAAPLSHASGLYAIPYRQGFASSGLVRLVRSRSHLR